MQKLWVRFLQQAVTMSVLGSFVLYPSSSPHPTGDRGVKLLAAVGQDAYFQPLGKFSPAFE